MTLSGIASIGSLLSAIAVLVSLIYLALQVRQAERNQRALMNQGAMTRATVFLTEYLQPDIADLYDRVIMGETEFSGREIFQLRVMLRLSVIALSDIHLQHRAGLVDQITLEHGTTSLQGTLRLPVMRAIWKGSRASYGPEVAAIVDGLIKTLPLSHPANPAAQLKADLAELLCESQSPHATP